MKVYLQISSGAAVHCEGDNVLLDLSTWDYDFKMDFCVSAEITSNFTYLFGIN
jgi:hypothetical protein